MCVFVCVSVRVCVRVCVCVCLLAVAPALPWVTAEFGNSSGTSNTGSGTLGIMLISAQQQDRPWGQLHIKLPIRL